MSNHQHVGFIGVGSITAAVVNGLCSKQAIPTIHLSPRSEDVSKALAAKFSNVHRATSNVEVISKSQIVVLAMRPEQLKAALSGLTFRPDQTVVSFVATVTLAEIAKLVAPASQVCRVTPLTFIEKRRGPIVMAPALASVNTLFDGLGDVLMAEKEEHMMAFGCAASLLSTFLELEHTVAQWLVATGVKPTVASQYVRSMFAGLANSAQETQNMALMTMAENNETPSGLNERVRVALRNAGMFTRVESVLSELASLSLAPSSDV